jgi:internalin A
LKNLVYLNIASCDVQNLDDLIELPSLIELNLSGNQIDSLAANSKMKSKSKLQTVIANDNQISNLEPFTEFTNLKELYLRDNCIKDISPLCKLKNFYELDIGENKILKKTKSSCFQILMKNVETLKRNGVQIRLE